MGPQDKAGAAARTQVHNAKVSQSLNYKNALKALNALASRLELHETRRSRDVNDLVSNSKNLVD